MVTLTVSAAAPLGGPSADTRAAAERAAELVHLGTNGNTLRSYRAAWEQWEAFCAANGAPALSAEHGSALLLVWIGALRREGLSVATVRARIAAIVHFYREASLASPADCPKVRAARRGLSSDAAARGERRKQARPLTIDPLRRVIGAIPGDVRGLRDRALLLLAFGGAFRRSELAALHRLDVEFRDGGLVVRLARSKTDQEGNGRAVPVRAGRAGSCPVAALRAWLAACAAQGIEHGPLFRSVNKAGRIGASITERAVWTVFRSRGLDVEIADLSGHSGRVGFVWSASLAGASVQEIASVTGHKALQTVLGYVGEAHLLHGSDPLRGALGAA